MKQAKQGIYARYIKRILDILLSGCALIVLSPVLLIVAVLVRAKLGSPVIFCQERPGKDEKIFKMYKFRSMYTDAEARKAELMKDNEMNGLMFKMKDDPRITKVGKFIRKTSIDELPQFFNVLAGVGGIIEPTKKKLDFTGFSLA